MAYPRYIIAEETAGSWGNFGGMGAMLANLAYHVEPSAIRSLMSDGPSPEATKLACVPYLSEI